MSSSAEIRQSFLDFFARKDHQIVPSASLMPDAPNLLFTNAGMNQFVPYFLGDRPAPFKRAADTQKCIRAGGKHNDLEDVGYDTYHHTFFEMLGNWSFGDYFKKESLEWSWELLTKVWGIPKERLYATVYAPGEGDPADFDQEAWEIWNAIFEREGLDSKVHLLTSRECFWAMGETGPCGPCSEIHMDLTEKGDTGGSLVDGDSPYCMELWNNVFIQFNACPDGTYEPLKNKYVDTGMGFERIAGIFASTKNLTEFGTVPSNYDSDLFTGIFDWLTRLSGHRYGQTVPRSRDKLSEAEMNDVAFRVLADHARTLSCSIADGILPGNEGRNYVLRRILRRAVMYGRRIGLETGFFETLVGPVIESLGGAFPELRQQEKMVRRVIQSEEESFGRTLDRGIQLFKKVASGTSEQISGHDAFVLYDTYGFPLDLTQLLARERGLSVDFNGFEQEMEQQRQRARAAQQRSTISVSETTSDADATKFIGYERENLSDQETRIREVIEEDGNTFLVFDRTPFYAEMGGQVGDRGTVRVNGTEAPIVNTIKDNNDRYLHQVTARLPEFEKDAAATLTVDREFRDGVQRHHSATHLLHHALRTVLGNHVRQAGSLVTDNRLRFDFSHFDALEPDELRRIEEIVNNYVIANSAVRWFETPFDQKPENCIAFFGEKYGSVVRVVDIGGYSVELCGGTHVGATGEIGLVKIISESAIASGTRRVEAVAGNSARHFVDERLENLDHVAERLSCQPTELENRIEQLLAQKAELEKTLRKAQQKEAGNLAQELAAQAEVSGEFRVVSAQVDVTSPQELRGLGADIVSRIGEGIVVLGAPISAEKVTIVAFCTPKAIEGGHKAGDIVRSLTADLGGKGGGKPDFAMGGGKNAAQLKPVLNELKTRLEAAN